MACNLLTGEECTARYYPREYIPSLVVLIGVYRDCFYKWFKEFTNSLSLPGTRFPGSGHGPGSV